MILGYFHGLYFSNWKCRFDNGEKSGDERNVVSDKKRV